MAAQAGQGEDIGLECRHRRWDRWRQTENRGVGFIAHARPASFRRGDSGGDYLRLGRFYPKTPMTMTTDTEFKTWMCLICGFIYDEAAGLTPGGHPTRHPLGRHSK